MTVRCAAVVSRLKRGEGEGMQNATASGNRRAFAQRIRKTQCENIVHVQIGPCALLVMLENEYESEMSKWSQGNNAAKEIARGVNTQ